LDQLSTARVPGYRPRPATNDLKEIVEDSMEELLRDWDARFRQSYGPLPARVRTLLERFTRCGDLHFGFVRLRCVNPDCKKKGERLVPFSCKSRHLCPSCSQRRAPQWAERMVEEVLPFAPYRQLVFTIPLALRKAFLFDRTLYGDLCRVAYASTRDYLREHAPPFPGRKKAVPAIVVSPQSHGDLLTHHPHAHSICSLGLFRSDGVYLPMEEVDFTGLEALFRERFFQLMLRRQKVLPETVERMRSWDHSGFNVDFARSIDAADRAGLEGLLSYMERAPVSLRRLTYRSDGMVHYQGTKLHPRLRTDHQLLTPVEFLAHLVHHVLLRYEISSRCYGAISTTFRRKLGWLEHPPVHQQPPEPISVALLLPRISPSPCDPLSIHTLPPQGPPTTSGQQPPQRTPTLRPAETESSEFLKKRSRGWAKLIARTWHEDPSLCASCGRPMKIIAALSSPEQDDVIERILRHLHRWNPPWNPQQKARGPPGPAGATSPRPPPSEPGPARTAAPTIDPMFPDEFYSVDDIPPDEHG